MAKKINLGYANEEDLISLQENQKLVEYTLNLQNYYYSQLRCFILSMKRKGIDTLISGE